MHYEQMEIEQQTRDLEQIKEEIEQIYKLSNFTTVKELEQEDYELLLKDYRNINQILLMVEEIQIMLKTKVRYSSKKQDIKK